MKALIDGDGILYKAGFAGCKIEKGVLLEEPPLSHTLQIAKTIMSSILFEVNAADYRVFIGKPKALTFRHELATVAPYKENRKNQLRPCHETKLREYLMNNWNASEVDYYETDDVLGIMQMHYLNTKRHSIIVSNDKDLDMIPGWHYDYEVGKKRKYNGVEIVLKEYKDSAKYCIEDPGFLKLCAGKRKRVIGGGLLWFFYQWLVGDRTDNIPGLHKIGPIKAYSLLKDCTTEDECLGVIKKMYMIKLSTLSLEEQFKYCAEIAQLVWIKRAKENDHLDLLLEKLATIMKVSDELIGGQNHE